MGSVCLGVAVVPSGITPEASGGLGRHRKAFLSVFPGVKEGTGSERGMPTPWLVLAWGGAMMT